MEKTKDYYEVDLLEVLKAMGHRIWLIILAAVLCGGLAFSYAACLIKPSYKAQAMMYVNNSSFSVGNTSFSISSAELTAAQSLVDTYIVILNSRTTLEDVIATAHLEYDYETLRSMLRASAVRKTEVFSIEVTDTDPEEAELIANTIVDILPGKIADVVDGSSVRVVDYAVVPSEKSAPNITKYTAIGVLLGILISCVAIVIGAICDNAIRNEDYLTNTYHLPVLAAIPDLCDEEDRGNYQTYGSNGKTGGTSR